MIPPRWKQASSPDRTALSGTQGNKPPYPLQQQQTLTKTAINKIDLDTTEGDVSIPSEKIELFVDDPNETLTMEQFHSFINTVK